MDHHRYAEAVASEIRRAMTEAGMSARALSERSSIPYVTLHRRLRGTSPLTTSELARIADAIGRSPSQLMAAAEAKQVPAA